MSCGSNRSWRSVLLLGLAACSSEVWDPTDRGAGANVDAPPAAEAEAGLALFRWSNEWTPDTDAVSGDTTMVLERRYQLIDLRPNGFAYVGRTHDDIDDVACEEASKDGAGRDVCVPYALTASELVLGGVAKPFARTGDDVTLGDEHWTALGAGRPRLKDFVLAGYFGKQEREAATTDGARLTLATNGRFRASRTATSYRILGHDLWDSCRGACVVEGTFEVRRRSIVMTPAGGTPRAFFLRASATELQIGDEWYR